MKIKGIILCDDLIEKIGIYYKNITDEFKVYQKDKGKFIIETYQKRYEGTYPPPAYKPGTFYINRLRWYWLNCVGCGKDISKVKSNYYHACSKCYYKNAYIKTPPLMKEYQLTIYEEDDERDWDSEEIPLIKDGRCVLDDPFNEECLIE